MRPSIESFLQEVPECACGRPHRITTKVVLVGSGALRELPRALKDSGLSGRPLLVFDENTRRVAGSQIAEVCGSDFSELVLSGDAHADETNRTAISDAAKNSNCAFLIAVGSGTINDLVKVAAHEAGLPYACVATAASMDGYLSANATILTGGNKLPYNNIRPPVAVVADTGLLKTAPRRMTLAGLGDALGKVTSMGDWKLNHILRGEHYCAPSAGLLREEVGDLLSRVSDPKVGIDDPGFLTSLVRALLVTGIVMQRLGNSTPASGGEHCVSHAMEMRGYAEKGHAPSLHGLQVSVGLERSLRAFDDLFRPASHFDFQKRELGAILEEHRLEWKTLGVNLDEVIDKKKKSFEECRVELDSIRGHSQDPDFSFLQKNQKAIRDIYERFSLPKDAVSLGLSKAELQFAVEHAVDVRPRITIFDLHFAAGTLSEYY